LGRVIVVVSGKGGVGKTTLVANLGIALAKKKYKVCVVDADIAMANLTLVLGMQSTPISLHEVLLGQATIHDAVYDGPDGLGVIPSGLSLETYRTVDSDRLAGVISTLKDEYDFVILDAPAGIEKTVQAAIGAAEEALLITRPTPPSIADVLKIKMTAQRLGTRITGVVINFARNEKGEINRYDISKMLESPIYGIIPFDDDVRKTFLMEKPVPVCKRNPGSQAAIAITKIADKLVGVEKVTDEKRPNPISRLIGAITSIFKKKEKPRSDLSDK